MNIERLKKLVREASDRSIDCVLLVPGKNLYYLTGLSMGMSERPAFCAVPVGGDPYFIVPGFEAERVRSQTGIDRIYGYADDEGAGPALDASGLARAGVKFCVEYSAMRVLELDMVRRLVPAAAFVDADPIIAGLRSRKDPEEIRRLENAARIADLACAAGIGRVRAGQTERRIAEAVQQAIRDQGVSGDQMVASGPRSAVPHSHTTDRVIVDGDPVWIDLVVFFEGYVADITRTCFCGRPSEEMRAVFEAVHRAQEKGRTLARPGMTGAEVDALCRGVIAEAGYGNYFTHRTGHGIGLDVHEDPYIVRSNRSPLRPNEAFTVEPGIYLPGRGGVRIEDDVILTEDGCRSLTRCPREI